MRLSALSVRNVWRNRLRATLTVLGIGVAVVAFVLLRTVFDAGAAEFHSAWFVLSLLTELVALLTLRTRGPSWRSAPSRLLLGLCVAVGMAGTDVSQRTLD